MGPFVRSLMLPTQHDNVLGAGAGSGPSGTVTGCLRSLDLALVRRRVVPLDLVWSATPLGDVDRSKPCAGALLHACLDIWLWSAAPLGAGDRSELCAGNLLHVHMAIWLWSAAPLGAVHRSDPCAGALLHV